MRIRHAVMSAGAVSAKAKTEASRHRRLPPNDAPFSSTPSWSYSKAASLNCPDFAIPITAFAFGYWSIGGLSGDYRKVSSGCIHSCVGGFDIGRLSLRPDA